MVAKAAGGTAVLLLEDYPDMLETSAQLLRLEGFDVTPCINPQQAENVLAQSEERNCRFRLMVSDWNLQRQNASALVEHACRLGIRVIILTGSPTQVADWLSREAPDHVRHSQVRVVTKGQDWLPAVHELLQ